MKTLKPFQKTAVDFLLARPHTLLADGMGLGKTFTTLSAVDQMLPKSVLIVCPSSIKQQWADEVSRETLFLPDTFIVKGRNSRIPHKATIIVNYDLLVYPEILSQLNSKVWDVGVYDEVHYCKSMDAKRTKAVFGKGGLVHCCKRNICLSGTPVLNRPIELYPMLKALAPEVLGKENTYEKFGIKFCRGWFDGRELNVQGASNEEELNARLREAKFMLRRLESDVGSQLPRKRHQVFVIEGEGEKLKELERLECSDFRKQQFVDDTPVATLRRQLAEKKVEKAMPIIEDIVVQVEKIVIFTHHHSVTDMVMAKYGDTAVKIDGSVSPGQRAVVLKVFREVAEVKVLVGQINAAGQGLDGMQDVCHNILFLEASWTPAEISQAIARCHRMGQKHSVLVQFIIWANSLEEHMLRVVLDKEKTINKIVGGSNEH